LVAVVGTQTLSQVVMAEQGRRRLTTNTPSLNEPKGRSLRKVVSLSGQFHANII
jgi:hypothetical protein